LREEARKKTGVEKDILIDLIEGDSRIFSIKFNDHLVGMT